MFIYYCLVSLVFDYGQALTRIDPLVDSPQGLIRGLQSEDGTYSMFLGIPYALIDKNSPFGPSSPHPKFDTAFEAHEDTAICPQMDEERMVPIGSLDCLHLNVFVPNSAAHKKSLPVLVYIYGGGFTVGYTGIYGTKYLVKHDVIVVTINYRVNAYGFFCFGTEEVPGNQGLKDQLLALLWIKNNIGAFGGNPNQVTIMGESAGAASVELHIYSKQERLFDKAIMESGSALAPWALIPSNTTYAFLVAEKLGFNADDIKEVISFLSKSDPKLIIAALYDLQIFFRPCIEKEFQNVEAFITEHPEISSVKKHVPILAGYNNNEELANFAYDPSGYIPFHVNLEMVFNLEKIKEVGYFVRRFYVGDKEIDTSSKEGVVNFLSDFRFNYPVQRSMLKHYDSGSRNIYYYLFSYDGERNFVKKLKNITEGGALHEDELGYLFDLTSLQNTTENDQFIIDAMTTMWTNFVKYGNPNPEITNWLSQPWLPINNNTLYYLDINSELVMKSRPFHERLTFWDLFYSANRHNLKAYENKLSSFSELGNKHK